MCIETAISGGEFDEAADPVSTATTDMNIETLYSIRDSKLHGTLHLSTVLESLPQKGDQDSRIGEMTCVCYRPPHCCGAATLSSTSRGICRTSKFQDAHRPV